MKRTFYLLKTLLVAVGLCVGANAWASTQYVGSMYTYDVVFGTPNAATPTGINVQTDFTTDYTEKEQTTVSLVLTGTVLAGNQANGRTYAFSTAPTSGTVTFKSTFGVDAYTYSCDYFSIRGTVNDGTEDQESYAIVKSPTNLGRDTGKSTILRIFNTDITTSTNVYTPRSVLYGIEVTIDIENQKVDYAVTYASNGSNSVPTQLSTESGSVSVPDGWEIKSVDDLYMPRLGSNRGSYYDNVAFYNAVPNETLYTATFTANSGAITPTVTIYSDAGRSVEVNNGELTNGTTYYYTATLHGYEDYEGSFTVNGANPSVSFTMTAKTVYAYTVNAVDAESGVIKANIQSGSCYADESATFSIPACVLVDGTLHFTANESYSKTETVSSNNQVFTYDYTTSTVDNVVFFVEGEDISGASTSTCNYNNLPSMSKMGRGSSLAVTTLPAGKYSLSVRYVNTNNSAHNVTILAGATEVFNKNFSGRNTQSAEFTLTEETALTLTATASSTSGVDYLYIVKTGEVKTIAESGYTSLASAYGLDFANATDASSNKTLKAYVVSEITKTAVTLTSVESAPANTGLILKGTASTAYTIPVTASPVDVGTNKLSAAVTTTAVEASTVYVVSSGVLKLFTGTEIPAGKAYLLKTEVPKEARDLAFSFDEEATGINNVENARQILDGDFYNLAGQRVAQPAKGLYIVNGKKVVIK